MLHPLHFSILENFIDTALTMEKKFKDNPTLDPVAETGPETFDWKKNKKLALQKLRSDSDEVLSSIFSLPPERMNEVLSGMLTEVALPQDADLWSEIASSVVRVASAHVPMQQKTSVFRAILQASTKHNLLSDSIIDLLVENWDAASFLQEGLKAVFLSDTLVAAGKAGAAASKIFSAAKQKLRLEDGRSLDPSIDWYFNSVNAISYSSLPGASADVITSLEILLSQAPDSEATLKSAVTLLHGAASHGSVPVVQYLLNRFDGLELDEQSLDFACKHNRKDLVEFIRTKAPNLPLEKAITEAAFCRGPDVLKLLGVGAVGPGQEANLLSEHADLAESLHIASKTAIASLNWEVLKLLVSDCRLRAAHVQSLLDCASTCTEPERAIIAVMSSNSARDSAYSIEIPWMAQAFSLKHLVLPVLQVGQHKRLQRGIVERVWSFAKPEVGDSPELSSPDHFERTLASPLAQDLGTNRISRDGRTFTVPGIGKISFGKGHIRLQESYNVREISSTLTPDALLSINAEFCGNFFAAARPDAVVLLTRVVAFDVSGSVRYNELRKVLRSFRRVGTIFDRLISHFKKTNLILPLDKLVYVAPKLKGLIETGVSYSYEHKGRRFEFTAFNALDQTRISTTLDGCGDRDANRLLNENMAHNDEIFICSIDNTVRVCIFIPSERNDDDVAHLLDMLASRATAPLSS